MRRWRYIEQGEDENPLTVIMTEKDILDTYYIYWSAEMRRVHRDNFINPEACIVDWVVVNWAEQIADEE